jgi:hypothetical protein
MDLGANWAAGPGCLRPAKRRSLSPQSTASRFCPRKQALAMQVLSAVALLEAFAPFAEAHVLQALRRGLRRGDVLVRKVPEEAV